MNWIIPLLASTVSLFFALILSAKFIKHKRIHELLYAISLFMFTIAAFGEFFSAAFGWIPIAYKFYYYPAITLVPIMAAGTMYTRFSRWIGHIFLAYVLILSIALLVNIIPAQVNEAVLYQAGVTIGGEAMPDEVRRFSFWLSGIGGMVMLGTALWAWWKSRLVGNLYIALGALIMSMGGRLAVLGWTSFLPLSELLGIIVLFYGVISLEQGKLFLAKKPLDKLETKEMAQE